MSIETIEQLAKQHAADRALLIARVQKLQQRIDAAKRRRLPGIKEAVSAVKDSHLRLHAAIDAERSVFDSPRTRVLHGIKVGLRKATGVVAYADPKAVVKLVRQHFKTRFDELVETKETPIKKAILRLPAADVKRIGCEIKGSLDEVVIKAADSEVDKLVDALLGKSDEEAAEGES